MTIAPDLVAQILRLHTVEKWRVGTIARQLHVHRDAVRRVLAGNNAPVRTSPLRGSMPFRVERDNLIWLRQVRTDELADA